MLSAFVRYLVPGATAVSDALAYPAAVGEFWMVGYLLIRGVRRHAPDAAPPTAGSAVPAVT